MAKKEADIGAFLADINPEYTLFVQEVHETLAGAGCTLGLQASKSGQVASFTGPDGGRVVANFVSRKTGPHVRVYADGIAAYEEELEALPPRLLAKIEKAGICRRLHDPTKCNARCPMGYTFTLNGVQHKKCRYNCFLLPLTAESLPGITRLLQRELACRVTP